MTPKEKAIELVEKLDEMMGMIDGMPVNIGLHYWKYYESVKQEIERM